MSCLQIKNEIRKFVTGFKNISFDCLMPSQDKQFTLPMAVRLAIKNNGKRRMERERKRKRERERKKETKEKEKERKWGVDKEIEREKRRDRGK
jgi:hypothetical protein